MGRLLDLNEVTNFRVSIHQHLKSSKDKRKRKYNLTDQAVVQSSPSSLTEGRRLARRLNSGSGVA